MGNIMRKATALGVTLTVTLILTLTFAACSGESSSDQMADDPPAANSDVAEVAGTEDASGYSVIEVVDGGTIQGTVRFEGTVPAPRAVAITEDVETCGDSQLVQLLSAEGGKLANAVVSLVDITEGAGLVEPASTPTIDQVGCRFTPHVLVAQANRPVHILNSDPLTHNVHTVSFDNRPVNRAQPKGVQQIEIEFDVAEKVRVKCDIHDWMGAWVVVIDHPYHALTDSGGSFSIENVPPGTYMLETWHEELGTTSQTVTITAGQTTDVTLTMTQS